jgi:hypothetical protein
VISKEFDLTLDLGKDGTNSNIVVTQEDVDVYSLNISITENGISKDLSSVAYITINFLRADGQVVMSNVVTSVDISRGKLRYDFGTIELEKVGRVTGNISFFGMLGEKITSSLFSLYVVDQIFDENAIASATEFSILTQLIADVGALAPSSWYLGEGLPDVSIGKNYDLYIDTLTAKVYRKSVGQWSYYNNFIQEATNQHTGLFSKNDKIALDFLVSVGFAANDKEVIDRINQLTESQGIEIEATKQRVSAIEDIGLRIGDRELIDGTELRVSILEVFRLEDRALIQSLIDLGFVSTDKATLDALYRLGFAIGDKAILDALHNIGFVSGDKQALDLVASITNATESKSGYMSVSDKQKMNSLPNQLASDLVDGWISKALYTKLSNLGLVTINASGLISWDDYSKLMTLWNKTETVIEVRVTNPAVPKPGQMWII